MAYNASIKITHDHHDTRQDKQQVYTIHHQHDYFELVGIVRI